MAGFEDLEYDIERAYDGQMKNLDRVRDSCGDLELAVKFFGAWWIL